MAIVILGHIAVPDSRITSTHSDSAGVLPDRPDHYRHPAHIRHGYHLRGPMPGRMQNLPRPHWRRLLH